MARLAPVAVLFLLSDLVLALSPVASLSTLIHLRSENLDENPVLVNVQGLTYTLHGSTVKQSLSLKIDITEAAEACYPPRLSLNDFPLSQDERGTGQGTFSSADGSLVTATWTFTCREDDDDVAWEHDVVVGITSLNGLPVMGKPGLAIGFQQTRDPHIVQVSQLECPDHSPLHEINRLQQGTHVGNEEDERSKYLSITHHDSYQGKGGIHALADLFSKTYYFFNPALLLLAANTSLTFGLLFYAVLRKTSSDSEKHSSRICDIRDEKHWSEGGATSMQEEIASFRNAVDFVGELIAVEEGRRGHVEKGAVNTWQGGRA